MNEHHFYEEWFRCFDSMLDEQITATEELLCKLHKAQLIALQVKKELCNSNLDQKSNLKQD